MRQEKSHQALRLASSSKDEAEGVLKNSLLSNLIGDETREDSKGFFDLANLLRRTLLSSSLLPRASEYSE